MATSPIAFSATSSSQRVGEQGSLARASLEIRKPVFGPSSLKWDLCGGIDFQFNPRQLQFGKSARWQRQSQPNSRSSAVPEFGGSQPVRLVLEMFLDATAAQGRPGEVKKASIVDVVEQLFNLVVPTEESLTAGKACPLAVIFRWGGLSGFLSVVCDVQVTYSLFAPNGTPIRATARVTLEEMPSEYGPQNPTSGSERPRATHRVVAGDSLASLAYREYGDARRWRDLARANDIDEPEQLTPGRVLMLPAVDDLESGGIHG